MYLNIQDYVNNQKKIIANQMTLQNISFGIIVVGSNLASKKYVDNKIKDCQKVGIVVKKYQFNKINNIKDFNSLSFFITHINHKYDKLMIQLPIEGATQEQTNILLNLISAEKDVDGLSSHSRYQPCTPKGIVDYVDRNFKPEPFAWTLIGNGNLVGKPISKIIKNRIEDKYFVINSKSTVKELNVAIEQSDIVVVGVGKSELIDLQDKKFDKKLIFDCGINFKDNKMCGDCMNGERQGLMSTSVPGGVGLLTRLALLENITKN